jgi:hypothetical protein
MDQTKGVNFGLQVSGYRSPANENGKQEILSEPNLEIDFKEP